MHWITPSDKDTDSSAVDLPPSEGTAQIGAGRVGRVVRDERFQQKMIVMSATLSGLRSAFPLSGEGAGALEMSIVSYDVRKMSCLLLKKSGYVMKQLLVHTALELSELKATFGSGRESAHSDSAGSRNGAH